MAAMAASSAVLATLVFIRLSPLPLLFRSARTMPAAERRVRCEWMHGVRLESVLTPVPPDCSGSGQAPGRVQLLTRKGKAEPCVGPPHQGLFPPAPLAPVVLRPDSSSSCPGQCAGKARKAAWDRRARVRSAPYIA